ncbi:hypothetical protein [Fortiea sp. LEGE XX443]|uniref:hypothetical protein n=1 Tax=Fortiea sp. LEGE XX443 TaxID=1828611 RepID=UPI001D15AB7E|nr:hypothetical protein [Fortiea sp. LEGE XX443]
MMDGICFETLILERVFQVPPKQTDAKTQVQFGIRIINQTATPHHFLIFFARPEFLQPNKQRVSRFVPNVNGSYNPLLSDLQLVMPGESINFLSAGYFQWQHNKLNFVFREKDGTYWIFSDFHPGKYSIQFTYENQYAAWEHGDERSVPFDLRPVYDHSRTKMFKVENIWVGNVSTPEIEFYLI